jgi:Na+-transporting methylmalonyl-CoA/oxaloacetate decarboxylase gamma subunit
MSPQLILTLQISLVGMGLVFGAIVLLWGVIAALMRISTRGSHLAEQEQNTYNYAAQEMEEERDRKHKAAIAAVAVAIALDKQTPHEFPLPPTAIVSAWQAVMRANNIRSRGSAR